MFKLKYEKFVKPVVVTLLCTIALFILFYASYQKSEQQRQEREESEFQPVLAEPIDVQLVPLPVPQAQAIVAVE